MPLFIKKSSTVQNVSSNNNAKFFSNLAAKLLEMAEATNKRIEEARNSNPCEVSSAVVLASITTPVMTIGVKYEYIEYINRYGPPPNGIFDEEILEQLRGELGITPSII